MKTTNRMRAISVAAPAIPPKPNTAAMIAMTKKMTAYLNMGISSSGLERATALSFHLLCPIKEFFSDNALRPLRGSRSDAFRIESAEALCILRGTPSTFGSCL